MSQQERHLTTEQLSALLDAQLPERELVDAQAHLARCQQCQTELAELRQTAALLHALPAVKPARSFVLSDAMLGSAPEPILLHVPAHRMAQPQRGKALRVTLRSLGAIAAVIGLFFMLSSLPFFHGGGTSGSAAMSAAIPASAQNSAGRGAQSKSVNNQNQGSAAYNTQTPAAQAVVTSTAHARVAQNLARAPEQSQRPTSPAIPRYQTFWLFNLSAPAGRFGLGLLLVIVGVMGIFLFTRRRQRG